MYPPKAEALDLSDLVDDLSTVFLRLARPAISVELVLHPEPLPILHDKFTTDDELLRCFYQAREMLRYEAPDRTGHIVVTTSRLILTPESAMALNDLNPPPAGDYCSLGITFTGWEGAPFGALWPRAGEGTG